jgi:hypothetical protein
MNSTMRTVVLPLVVVGTTAAQTPHLDQSYVPPSLTNGLEVTQNQPVTQTFTVGRTGQLLQVEISRIEHHNGVSSNPLQVAIVATTSTGVPTTNVLASASVQPSAVSVSIAPLLVDVSAANLFVLQGQVLGLALTSPNLPGTPSYGWWGEAPGGGYANGQVFIQGTVSLSVWDLSFQTFVADTASWSTYGVGHPGTMIVPQIFSTANPVIGTTPDIFIGNSSFLPTLGALFFGDTSANVPTPWGGTALVVPITSVTFAMPPGSMLLPFPIPNDHSFCGLVLFMQAVMLDAGASAGLSFTPGMQWVVGH